MASNDVMKVFEVNAPGGSISGQIGAEAQNIDVSFDNQGNIVEDITGKTGLEVQRLSTTLKNIKFGTDNAVMWEEENELGAKNFIPIGTTIENMNGIKFEVATNGMITISGRNPSAIASFRITFPEELNDAYIFTIGDETDTNRLDGKLIVKLENSSDATISPYFDGNGTNNSQDKQLNIPINSHIKYFDIVVNIGSVSFTTPFTIKPMLRPSVVKNRTYATYAMSNRQLTNKVNNLHTTFAELDDTSFNNLQNGQFVQYNSSNQKWENKTITFEDKKVEQTPTITDANYEILFSGSADNTPRTEGAKKNDKLRYNARRGSLMEGNATCASGTYSHAEGDNTKAINTHSHAEGSGTTARGSSSHAEGMNTIADGDCSHAEGYNTTASGKNSHAEGSHTLASHSYAHAEGDGTTASNVSSHAEGGNTRASGTYSHAEGGGTLASGNFSHAEGYNTLASGHYSHAEGYQTIAAHANQHVSGEYNSNKTTTLFEIGNGSATTARSNAFEVYSDGNLSTNNGTTKVKLENLALKTSIPSAASSAPGDITTGTASVGSSTNYARQDHTHKIATATTSTYGATKLNSATNSTSTSEAATPSAVKAAYDLAASKGTGTVTQVKVGDTAYNPSSGVVSLPAYPIDTNDAVMQIADNTTNSNFEVLFSNTADNITRTESARKSSKLRYNANKGALMEGDQTTASAMYSHAEGGHTIADGNYSHAEGASTTANNLGSHSEGYKTFANGGNGSHVEGCYTYASGSASHAEGYSTCQNRIEASGKGAHAEGYTTSTDKTVASGDGSHAEGCGTTAGSFCSHAEGGYTKTSGNYSHAEGANTSAFGNYSHAEGESTLASGDDSHAEGLNTTASGISSHAEGVNTCAVGDSSHSEGCAPRAGQIIAIGEGSHAEGYGEDPIMAFGKGSHAEGNGTTASGTYSHAEGYKTSAQGEYSHTEGWNTVAEGINSHAEGYETIAKAGSHAEGNNTLASGDGSHAEGTDTLASGAYSHAEGDQPTAQGAGSHAEGCDTLAEGNHSHAEGEVTKAIGENSHAEGNASYAKGTDSHAEGASTTASSGASHAEGANTLASGGYSHAEGSWTIASGNCSHAEGNETTADGNYTHAAGYQSVAKVNYSYAIGNQGETDDHNLATKGNQYFAIGGYRELPTIEAASSTQGTYMDIGTNNVFSVDNLGNFFSTGAHSLACGEFPGTMTTATGPIIKLEDGALYLLSAHGRKVNGTTGGAQVTVISTGFNPSSAEGTMTTASTATPYAFNLGATATPPLTIKRENYTDPSYSNQYHGQIRIGASSTHKGTIRWNLVKILGSLNDF